MTHWLRMSPATPGCCQISIATRKWRDPLAQNGGSVTCGICGKVWTRIGDEIRELPGGPESDTYETDPCNQPENMR